MVRLESELTTCRGHVVSSESLPKKSSRRRWLFGVRGIAYKTKRPSVKTESPFVVRLEGLEPPTYWFVASHSIQLSYSRIPSHRQLDYFSTVSGKKQALFSGLSSFSQKSSSSTSKGGISVGWGMASPS